MIDDFERVFAVLVAALSDLLGVPIRPRTPAAQTAVGQALRAIIRFHARGDVNHRDWNLLRLGLLEQQLRVVADKRPDLLPGYRQRLLSDDLEHYAGTRFEILVAANLAERGLSFSTPEPPDFLIHPDDIRIPIECTSTSYRGADASKLRAKIRKALNKKARLAEDYVSAYGGITRLCVFIDVTNLFHGSDMRGRIFVPPDVEAYVGARLVDLNLASAILFTLVLDRTRDSLEAVYLRVDGPSIAPEVLCLLDEIFPINRAKTYTDYLFPPGS